MKSILIAAIFGAFAMASVAHAEGGGTKAHDMNDPSHQETAVGCMDMPCCKGMKAQDMKNMDCADMPCCKNKMEQGACEKVLKANKKK